MRRAGREVYEEADRSGSLHRSAETRRKADMRSFAQELRRHMAAPTGEVWVALKKL